MSLVLENVFYINLEHRHDRRVHVEKELNELNWKYTRFNALNIPKFPALGCTLSHLKLLEIAKEQNLEYIVIVEDDICFNDKTIFLNNLKELLDSKKHFDVCLISGNIYPPFKPFYDKIALQVSRSYTTSGYIVKNHYYDKLINNIKTGANLLINNKDKINMYAIDVFWIQLQKVDTWVIIIPLTVTQIESYSDIERRKVNYDYLMLNTKNN